MAEWPNASVSKTDSPAMVTKVRILPLPVFGKSMHVKINIQKLRKWFLNHRRELPWRENPDPYAVWVSEVMLQQTQVSVVIPYFERWMELYPTIESLANAPLDHVIKSWEGLGYYSRARNLHSGAKFVMQHYGGKLPSCPEKLKKIKGLGDYTVGAIRSFAFNERAAAVDGNVIRVLSRYFLIKDDISKTKTLARLKLLAEGILPYQEPWIIAEALIELGAKVCSKKPKCDLCPLKDGCQAFQKNQQNVLPYKSKKTEIKKIHRAVFVLLCKNHLLVKREIKGKIMSDLHEFPYVELNEINQETVAYTVDKLFGFKSESIQSLPEVSHSFTRYRVKLSPYLIFTEQMPSIENYQWIPYTDIKNLAFSSGHRRILQSLTGHLE